MRCWSLYEDDAKGKRGLICRQYSHEFWYSLNYYRVVVSTWYRDDIILFLAYTVLYFSFSLSLVTFLFPFFGWRSSHVARQLSVEERCRYNSTFLKSINAYNLMGVFFLVARKIWFGILLLPFPYFPSIQHFSIFFSLSQSRAIRSELKMRHLLILFYAYPFPHNLHHPILL